MYGIYAKIWGILMGSMSPYIAAYMDPMGMITMITAASPSDPGLCCRLPPQPRASAADPGDLREGER